jgi:flagellar motor switch protein FliM
MSLCLPFSVLDTFFADSQLHRKGSVTGSQEERRAIRDLVGTKLRVTRLEVAARLPEFRIPMRTLMSLEEGSVLATGIPSNAEVDVFVSGQPRYKGTAARVGRRLAVSVNNPVAHERADGKNPNSIDEGEV